MADENLGHIGPDIEEQLKRARETSDLQYRHIDWEFDPNSLKDMSPEEAVEQVPILAEQMRRIYYAQRQIAKRVGGLSDKEGDISLAQEVDMIHNPDQYPTAPEPQG